VRQRWFICESLLVGALGCGADSSVAGRVADAHLLPAALADVAAHPEEATEICGRLQTAAARGDCVLHGVERLARQAPDTAANLCAWLDGLDADECLFQVAERSGDPQRCSAAGRFAEDCLMHAWTVQVPKLAGPTAGAVEWGQRIAAAAAEMGFSESDPRPWVAASRFLLGRSTPLDRSFCDAWADRPREVCRQAGLGLFHDRINHVRDAGKWSCEGAAPDLLAFPSEDTELANVLVDRKGEMCP
jgi:hypothetical protein